MPISDTDIEQSLSFSEKIDGIITGHQQETQQVLAQNRHLCTIIRDQQSKIKRLEAKLAQKEAENQLLRSKPNISIQTDQYFEHVTANQIVTKRRLTSGKKSTNTNQLYLWKDNPAILS